MPAAPSTIATRPAVVADLAAIRALHARVFGPGRFVRTAYRVREGTPDVSAFCRVALLGERLVAAIRMTEVRVGDQPGALLLGPLAVDRELEGQGHARRLVAESIAAARAAGRRIVLLVGDLPYYGRLGFVGVPPGQIVLPGPADPARILALELVPGALAGCHGLVAAAAAPADGEAGKAPRS